MPEDLAALLAATNAFIKSEHARLDAEYEAFKVQQFQQHDTAIELYDFWAQELNASTDRLLVAIRRDFEKKLQERTDKKISKVMA